MAQPRRTSIAPWITAAVAGVVLLALLLVFFLWLRPDEKDADSNADGPQAAGQLTTTEREAMNAAATEMINLVSFSRDNFDSDFKRAIDGTTGALRQDVQDKRAKTLEAITKGKFDLFGKVTHKALSDTVPATDEHGAGYVVLISINGFRSTNPTVPIPQNLAVTVIDVGGKWLAADVTYIGITG
jgi:hypothetical protein